MRRLACLTLAATTLTLHALACAAPAAPPPVPSRTVTVTGAVEKNIVLDVEQLRKRPADQIVTLQLPSKPGATPTTVRGVRLRELVAEAKVISRDHNTPKKLAIIASATDGYKVVFSWSELFNSSIGDDVLVLFERDGKSLDGDEGPLALLSARDTRTGPRHVRWLQAIEVRQIVD